MEISIEAAAQNEVATEQAESGSEGTGELHSVRDSLLKPDRVSGPEVDATAVQDSPCTDNVEPIALDKSEQGGATSINPKATEVNTGADDKRKKEEDEEDEPGEDEHESESKPHKVSCLSKRTFSRMTRLARG